MSWLDRWRPFHGPSAVDVIEVQVALIERPPGDPFLNQELWTLADEQIVPLERKALLEENGFRVGQLGGNTPAGLLTLLTSEQSNVNPRHHLLHAGQAVPLVLGPITPLCAFRLQQDGQPMDVALENAQSTLQLVANLTGDGRTRLQFTPQVRHGDKKLVPRAAEDGSGFILQEEWPTKSYASLSWEVTVAANQYVLVGSRADRPETFGYQCFVRRTDAVPAQRLLVIRTSRLSAPPTSETLAESSDETPSPSRTPPLALQAAWTKARSSSP
jgi:hypothetical protein